ncbi:deoxycytidine triphosphate deaminase [Candidatus Parcubacteria bacterium]|jgi:dCTP deaminase|nr:MAG: deoxycytidine triphosphate deaminase [Candidatus Parcubacteria bacterium]
MSLKTEGSPLTRDKILEHKKAENIFIHPFNLQNLKTTSYDVRLGNIFYRENTFRGERNVFNPFDEQHVRKFWGEPQQATPASEWMRENGELKNIRSDDLLIVIGPNETILAHTVEFIGGRNCVSTEMRARSTMGRIGITVCKCAGWGDLGYINRWTMEMTNHLTNASIPLVVGMRVAQIIFYNVEPIQAGTYASEQGKYQDTDDIEALIKNWTPDKFMIPKLYKDEDIGSFRKFAKI